MSGLTPGNLATLAEVTRGVLDRCTCTPYPVGEGPEIDCPMHGRADYQAVHITDALAPVIAAIFAVQRESIAREFETDAARAWGGDASWFTTGSHAAALAAEWVRSDAAEGTADDLDAEARCKCGHSAWVDHGGIMAPPSGCDECFCTLNEEQAAAGVEPMYSSNRGGAQ